MSDAAESKPVEQKKYFKGFDKNWKCRDYQFAVGGNYEHDGEVNLCKSGFHACLYPLDVFNYYSPGEGSNFAQVEMDGVSEGTKDSDTKRAGKSVSIKLSLTIPMLISSSVEYVTNLCSPTDSNHATGDQSASSATGDNAIAAVFGLESKAKAGESGIVIVAWWDKEAKRKRVTTGYVGQAGIKPDVWYCCDESGDLKEF